MPWVPKKYSRDKPRPTPTSLTVGSGNGQFVHAPEELRQYEADRLGAFVEKSGHIAERWNLDVFEVYEKWRIRRDWYLLEMQGKGRKFTDTHLEKLEDRMVLQVCRDLRKKRGEIRKVAKEHTYREHRWEQEKRDGKYELVERYTPLDKKNAPRRVHRGEIDPHDPLRPKNESAHAPQKTVYDRAAMDSFVQDQSERESLWGQALDSIRSGEYAEVLEPIELEIIEAKFWTWDSAALTDNKQDSRLLTDAEIGERLGIPTRTVNYKLNNALDKLRRYFNARHDA